VTSIKYSTNSEDIERNKDKEANNAFKVETIALEENKAKAKITSTYDATTRYFRHSYRQMDLPLPGVNVLKE
jgi:hypothetical protein